MNRRITKNMAEEASAIIKKKTYDRKIEEATVEVNNRVEKLVLKYIPSAVISIVNEFSTYFNYTKCVGITTSIERKNGYITSAYSIGGTLSFMIPSASRYIKVDRYEYEALLKVENRRKLLVEECEEFGKQIYDALLALRTEKAVEKELPEAMKYLVFPEVKALPMPIFTGLRDTIGKIKEEG